MPWRPGHHRVISPVADAVAMLISFVATYYLWLSLRSMAPEWPIGYDFVLDPLHFIIMVAMAGIWVLILSFQGAYSYKRFTSLTTEVKAVLKTVLWGTLVLFGLVFLLRPGYVPRSLVALFIATNLGLLTLEKFLLFIVAQKVRRQGRNRKAVLVVGTGDLSKQFVETIKQHFHWELEIVGFLDAAKAKVGQEIFGNKVLGTFHDIPQVLQAHPVDEVIIAVSTRRLGELPEVLEACELEGVQVRIISDFLGKIAKGFRADVVYGLPIISISYIPENQAALAVKRGMDIVIPLIALILLTPLFAIIATAIKFSSPGPVFYEWNVVGFNKKPFKSWKFRTMLAEADRIKAQLAPLNEMTGPVFKICKNPRVTPVGRFLRKYSLDELPHLWSVLKGDMSLVGPRPAGPHEVPRYES